MALRDVQRDPGALSRLDALASRLKIQPIMTLVGIILLVKPDLLY